MDEVSKELECPVCLLVPRQPPIFLCPGGHLICLECRPKVAKCPVCKVNYLKSRQTRNFFAEKVLESIKRRCRYELFGCDFAFHESSVLVAHEKVCDLRPEGAADDLGSAEDSSDGEGEHVDEAGVGQEEQLDAVNNPMFLNLVFFYDTRPFLHFYAVAVVFLRTFISHFGDVKRPSGDWVELVFLCLGWGWLLARSSKSFRRFLDIYQPDEFATQFAVLRRHLRNLLFQDANSIYSGLLVWILVVITALHHLKNLVRNSSEQELALNRYQAVLFFLKPTVTIATGFVTIGCHLFNNWGRLDKWAAAFGTFRLLWLAANLAFVEVVLSTGSRMDEGFSLIFWLQALLVHLPNGKISFILLEIFGFIILLCNAFDTLVLDNLYKNDFMETFHRGFIGGYLEAQGRAEVLRRQMKELGRSLGVLDSVDFDGLFKAADEGKLNLKKLLDAIREEL